MAVDIICGWCGSRRVSRDAWADWDVAWQEWVLSAVFDQGFCHQCERERSLVEAAVDVPASVAT